jgi:hypothetical protein
LATAMRTSCRKAVSSSVPLVRPPRVNGKINIFLVDIGFQEVYRERCVHSSRTDQSPHPRC